MQIVIVDDHGLFRAGLEQLIRNIDASVSIESFATVADMAAAQDPIKKVDLVLLDYHLPGASGKQTLAAVQSKLPMSKIVIVSAETDPQKIMRAIASGACGFIPKSANPELLNAALTLILAGGIFLPEQLARHYQGLAGSTTQAITKAKADPTPALSPRQRDALKLALHGLSNQKIANALNISIDTVKAHLSQAYKALGVHSRTQAILWFHNNKSSL